MRPLGKSSDRCHVIFHVTSDCESKSIDYNRVMIIFRLNLAPSSISSVKVWFEELFIVIYGYRMFLHHQLKCREMACVVT